MKLFDWLMAIGIVLLLIVGFFCVSYYFSIQNQKCMHNPFVYGAKQLEDTYGKEAYGSVAILDANFPRIYFNSENISFEK